MRFIHSNLYYILLNFHPNFFHVNLKSFLLIFYCYTFPFFFFFLLIMHCSEGQNNIFYQFITFMCVHEVCPSQQFFFLIVFNQLSLRECSHPALRPGHRSWWGWCWGECCGGRAALVPGDSDSDVWWRPSRTAARPGQRSTAMPGKQASWYERERTRERILLLHFTSKSERKEGTTRHNICAFDMYKLVENRG